MVTESTHGGLPFRLTHGWSVMVTGASKARGRAGDDCLKLVDIDSTVGELKKPMSAAGSPDGRSTPA
jgi:hypothetical protein